MPLYGQGPRRPNILRVALALNDWLSRRCHGELPADRTLPTSSVVGCEETRRLFSGVDQDGLLGAAHWYDAMVVSPQRLLIEILHWASQYGAVALSNTHAKRLLTENGSVTGVVAIDRVTDERLQFRSPVVVNCAGPWCRDVAQSFHQDVPELFHPSLAFNVLIDRQPLSSLALALSAKDPGSRTYFLIPQENRVLAGTYHTTCQRVGSQAAASQAQVQEFLKELNLAVPGWRLQPSDVMRLMPDTYQPSARDHPNKPGVPRCSTTPADWGHADFIRSPALSSPRPVPLPNGRCGSFFTERTDRRPKTDVAGVRGQ